VYTELLLLYRQENLEQEEAIAMVDKKFRENVALSRNFNNFNDMLQNIAKISHREIHFHLPEKSEVGCPLTSIGNPIIAE
jgi:hypothetical protein